MFESVYDLPPVWTAFPSSDQIPMQYPVFGTAANASAEPYVTVFAVLGLVMVPFAPADGVIVNVSMLKVTDTVWLKTMFESVYVVPPLCTTAPSNHQPATVYPVDGIAVKVRLVLYVTV